jgi:hypothetical protein
MKNIDEVKNEDESLVQTTFTAPSFMTTTYATSIKVHDGKETRPLKKLEDFIRPTELHLKTGASVELPVVLTCFLTIDTIRRIPYIYWYTVYIYSQNMIMRHR